MREDGLPRCLLLSSGTAGCIKGVSESNKGSGGDTAILAMLFVGNIPLAGAAKWCTLCSTSSNPFPKLR